MHLDARVGDRILWKPVNGLSEPVCLTPPTAGSASIDQRHFGGEAGSVLRQEWPMLYVFLGARGASPLDMAS